MRECVNSIQKGAFFALSIDLQIFKHNKQHLRCQEITNDPPKNKEIKTFTKLGLVHSKKRAFLTLDL